MPAALAGLLHAAFALAIQLENLAACCAASGLKELLQLPFLQLENLLAALLLAVAVAGLWRFRGGRWIAIPLFAAANLALVAHQVAYKIYLAPLRPGMLMEAGHPGLLLDSVTAELDAWFYANLAIAVALSAGWAWGIRCRLRLPGAGLRRRSVLAGLAAFLGASFWLTAQGGHMNLERHPLVALAAGALRPPPADSAFVDASDIFANRFDTYDDSPEIIRRLADYSGSVRQRTRPPNVVLIVLESSGSRNVISPDGLPDPSVTPVLSRLAKQGVVFDSLYTNFPGTVHSNLAMMTGGFYTTWQPIAEAFGFPYRGPTLARAFSSLGYATGLFASADLGHYNFRDFVRQAGYESLFDFGQMPGSEQMAHRLNSWGGRDDVIAARAIEWLDRVKGGERPFFLHFMTNAPHHPYATPPGFTSTVAVEGKRGDYLRALNYADGVVGEIIQALEAKGLLRDTVIAVTGDHGEAFGYFGSRPKTHMGSLFEENVRNFLLLSGPSPLPAPIVSGRIGSEGDILATLAALAGKAVPEVAGQDLLAAAYRSHMVFFHVDNRPGSWGLRDGRWKYISSSLGAAPELYDLGADPNEQNNLAAGREGQIAAYERLLASWFVHKNREYMGRVEGGGTGGIAAGALKSAGPKLLEVGYLQAEGNRVAFVGGSDFNPNERLTARSQWVSFSEPKVFQVEWRSPSGKTMSSEISIRPETRSLRTRLPAGTSLEPGNWTVSIKEGARTWLTHPFRVSPKTALAVPPEMKVPRLLSLSIGRYYQGQLLPTAELSPRERFVLKSGWAPEDTDEPFTYLLVSPNQVAIPFEFKLPAGAEEHMQVVMPPEDMQAGRWRLVLWGRGGLLGTTDVKVEVHSASAKPR